MIALQTRRQRHCPETSESGTPGFEPTWLDAGSESSGSEGSESLVARLIPIVIT
jgi:hypothetical protein